jgi:hypothetical protein
MPGIMTAGSPQNKAFTDAVNARTKVGMNTTGEQALRLARGLPANPVKEIDVTKPYQRTRRIATPLG